MPAPNTNPGLFGQKTKPEKDLKEIRKSLNQTKKYIKFALAYIKVFILNTKIRSF